MTSALIPAAPAASADLVTELLDEIMECADPEGGKAHQLLLRAASALARAEPKGPREWLTDPRTMYPAEHLESIRNRLIGQAWLCQIPGHDEIACVLHAQEMTTGLRLSTSTT